jgi:hypothetical protein
MDKFIHYHVESGSIEHGPTLSIQCGQRDEMLKYLDRCSTYQGHLGGQHASEGYMKGSAKGRNVKFLYAGGPTSVGYEYTEVRTCAASTCH